MQQPAIREPGEAQSKKHRNKKRKKTAAREREPGEVELEDERADARRFVIKQPTAAPAPG